MRRFLIVFSVLAVCVAASVVGVGAPLPRAAAADPVIAAAGDLVCAPPATRTARRCHDRETADLLLPGGPVADASAVLPLGDEQYECGKPEDFSNATGGYARSWGQPLIKDKSRPIVGDNEYAGGGCSTPGARGYFSYFGAAANHPTEPTCMFNCKGYYSYNVGSWHMVALNSECTQPGVGGCSATSPQVTWLKADLDRDSHTCELAYFHRPYFSDKGGTVAKVRQLFKALFDRGVDVLLVGHQHIYQRFALQNPNGNADPSKGVRQFIVGTGGKSTTALASPAPTGAESRSTGTFGVLKLTLHANSYDFQFVPEAGKTFTDSGSNQACH
jgi:acid phosphatase type 7